MDGSPSDFFVCGVSRQEYWSGLSFPPIGGLPNPGIKRVSPAPLVDSLPLSPQGRGPQSYTGLNFPAEVETDVSYPIGYGLPGYLEVGARHKRSECRKVSKEALTALASSPKSARILFLQAQPSRHPQGHLTRPTSLLPSDHKKCFPSFLTGQLPNKGVTLRG